MLKLLRSLPALLVAPLLITAAPAPAQQAPAQQAPRPATLQDYQPKPAIWLLADEDTKIYLFGTVHFLPPGFKWRSPAFDRIAKESGELVLETHEEPGAPEDPAVMQTMLLERPVPILSRVPKKHRKPLKAAIEEAGLQVEMLSMFRTWMAAMILGITQQLQGWGVGDPSEAPGVEDVLEAEFRAAGKPILSVENGAEVLASFNQLPEQMQVDLLLGAIHPDVERDEDELAELDRLWALGRFEESYPDMVKDFPPIMFETLVRKRNAAWTEWLSERLKRPGTVLFAVGAAHLAGDQSVQTMLEAKGLRVRRFD